MAADAFREDPNSEVSWPVAEPRIFAYPDDSKENQEKFYPFLEKLRGDNLEPFIQQLLNNDLQEYFKSEPIPQPGDETLM